MTPEEHTLAAQALLDAERIRNQIKLLSLGYPDMEMADAYAIQNAIYRAKRQQGRTVIGWKIGLTSRAMQNALNINIPDSGILFDDMEFENGQTIPKDRFIQPRVEAEIAFVMKTTIGGDNLSREDVINATDYIAPALEILDTRIQRTDPQTGKPATFSTPSAITPPMPVWCSAPKNTPSMPSIHAGSARLPIATRKSRKPDSVPVY